MLKPQFAGMFLAAAACALPLRGEDAWGRLTADKLEAVHQAVVKLQADRKTIGRTGPFKEYRANLHVHSSLSHDSRGTIDEILAAAKAVGTHVVMFTEHPAAHYDFFTDGHQGMRDGILLIPGAETKGLLAFPRQSVGATTEGTPQEFADIVRGAKGISFLSHLEERMDWELRGLTGVEIYNTHADFKDEKRMLAAMRNPLWLLSTAPLFRKYPQEAFSALQHHPADYLRRWDELCATAPHTGVSANDSHQNVGLTVRLSEGGKARIEDGAGEKLLEVAAAEVADVVPLAADAKPGSVLFKFRLDPYENSLRHVGTHLLMTELGQPAVWEALERGRAFVAFDWIADATGFQFAAVAGKARHEMGSRVALAPDLRLIGQSPLPARWKLIKNGKLHLEIAGDVFDVPVTEPGIYRVELSLDVAGEERTWILSNPTYIAGQ
jgi:Predicted metal-dependent phosphoesterases (PHP family)